MTLFALLILFVLWVRVMEEAEYEHWLVMHDDFDMIEAMWNWGHE